LGLRTAPCLGDLVSTVRDYGRLNQTTLFSYDGVGDILATTDPNGNVTTSSWDADRRLTSVVSPPGILVTLYLMPNSGMARIGHFVVQRGPKLQAGGLSKVSP
jgi:YD repeat-containing protein